MSDEKPEEATKAEETVEEKESPPEKETVATDEVKNEASNGDAEMKDVDDSKKESTETEAKEEPKEELKEELKEEPKEESKEEPKEEPKEEETAEGKDEEPAEVKEEEVKEETPIEEEKESTEKAEEDKTVEEKSEEKEVKKEETSTDEKKESEKPEEEAEEKVSTPTETPSKTTEETPRSSSKRSKKTSLDSLMDDSIQVPTSIKRERKQVGVYAPENFKEENGTPKKTGAVNGRGKKIKDLPSAKDSISKTAAKDPVLVSAYKLVFGGSGGRGRGIGVNKRLIKGRLLDFNGYLEATTEGEDKEEREALDQIVESKMATRAYKMTIPLLKSLCDLFDIDRVPPEGKVTTDKDTLIDRLLDFLSAPDEKYLKSSKKKKTTPKKRKVTTSKSPTPKKKKMRKEIAKKAKQEEKIKDESETEDEMDVESEESEEENPKMPTDKMLRKWVRAYVNCFNLDKATTKHAIETASDRFGVDLSEKKIRIKELLTEEMS